LLLAFSCGVKGPPRPPSGTEFPSLIEKYKEEKILNKKKKE
jgi:hypothetical protein